MYLHQLKEEGWKVRNHIIYRIIGNFQIVINTKTERVRIFKLNN